MVFLEKASGVYVIFEAWGAANFSRVLRVDSPRVDSPTCTPMDTST